MAKKTNSRPTWRTSTLKTTLYEVMEKNTTIILFDVETSGLSPENDRIIQLSGVKYHPEGDLLEEVDRISVYIKPPFEISQKIIELTGITNEFLATQRPEEEVVEEIYNFFSGEYAAAAYNSSFDVRFVKSMFVRHSLGFKPLYELDVLAMARDLVDPKDTGNYKLKTIAALYGVDKGVTFHNAIDDAIVTGRLLETFIKEYHEKDAEDERLKQEEIEKSLAVKTIAKINSMKFWEGYRGFSRIYVNTDMGTLYYDVRSKRWSEKDAGVLERIDMEQLQKDALIMAGAASEDEFAKYRAS